MHYLNLYEVIKERRESLKVTQEELSKLSGVALRTIKQFESGKGNPTLKTIKTLGDVLGIELSFKTKSLEINEEG